MLPRPEYPRPQFVREKWQCLNGEWEFSFDDHRIGEQERWYKGTNPLSNKIIVPFTFESSLSGIGDTGFHDVVWYRKLVNLDHRPKGSLVILHFGAVDYEAKVWINGELAVRHEGGHTPFQVEISRYLQQGDNAIVVQAIDYGKDVFLPRGKQFWKEKSEGIWYTRTTGIWQTVWLEFVPPYHLDRVQYTPDIDRNEIQVRAWVNGDLEDKDVRLRMKITFDDELISEDEWRIQDVESARAVPLGGLNDHGMDRFWSPERPNLYDVEYNLIVDGMLVDRVLSYFGMRKISVDGNRIYLNNRPYYMKLVLDQGYYPEGNLTPPSDEAIKQDIKLTKEMGFNGARKHQKVEDPRYLYWCDKLGLLVWGEMASACDYSSEYARRITQEWQEVIKRDYNHPCIVVWVPLNESWGVPNIANDIKQQQHALAMYHLTKSLDTTRLVVSNDGWEMVTTDLYNIHDYEWRQEVLEERYRSLEQTVSAMPAKRRLSVGGHRYAGQPILVTEFGGIAFKQSDWNGWGYSGAENEEDFLARLRAVMRPLQNSPVVQGYCYTQLTDVEQEINGLLTYDRKPKVPLEKIRAINEG